MKVEQQRRVMSGTFGRGPAIRVVVVLVGVCTPLGVVVGLILLVPHCINTIVRFHCGWVVDETIPWTLCEVNKTDRQSWSAYVAI